MEFIQSADFKWTLTLKEWGSITLHDLTLQDIIWLKANNVTLTNNTLSLLVLYNRLIDTEGFLVSELPLNTYTAVLEAFAHNVLSERIMSIDSGLEMLWFLGGQSFSPDIQKWFDVPMTLLLAMAQVAKKHPPQRL